MKILPGFVEISGTRKPPKSWGDSLVCQLRGGDGQPEPFVDPYGKGWDVKTTNWIHTGGPMDVVAVMEVRQ